jgi:hypothetical protein
VQAIDVQVLLARAVGIATNNATAVTHINLLDLTVPPSTYAFIPGAVTGGPGQSQDSALTPSQNACSTWAEQPNHNGYGFRKPCTLAQGSIETN